MKHTHEETQEALKFLENFNTDEEYHKNLDIIYDYMSDIVDLFVFYKDAYDKLTTPANREQKRKLEQIMKKQGKK